MENLFGSYFSYDELEQTPSIGSSEPQLDGREWEEAVSLSPLSSPQPDSGEFEEAVAYSSLNFEGDADVEEEVSLSSSESEYSSDSELLEEFEDFGSSSPKFKGGEPKQTIFPKCSSRPRPSCPGDEPILQEEEEEVKKICPDFAMIRESRVRLNWYQKYQARNLVRRALIGEKRSVLIMKNRPNKKQRKYWVLFLD